MSGVRSAGTPGAASQTEMHVTGVEVEQQRTARCSVVETQPAGPVPSPLMDHAYSGAGAYGGIGGDGGFGGDGGGGDGGGLGGGGSGGGGEGGPQYVADHTIRVFIPQPVLRHGEVPSARRISDSSHRWAECASHSRTACQYVAANEARGLASSGRVRGATPPLPSSALQIEMQPLLSSRQQRTACRSSVGPQLGVPSALVPMKPSP